MKPYAKEKQKILSVDNLRHAEYYDMQNVFDSLYAKSKNGDIFENLVDLILKRENILLAYRNIKNNTGSHTVGTDNLTINDIGKLSADDVVEKVRKILFGSKDWGYRPRPVRRKEIPKPNGSIRPLGIPCIWDRLIQQCIKQIILASVFIPIFLAIPIYMLCAGLMSGAVLTRTPQYKKKSKFNKVCVALSMGISMLMALKFGFTFELLKATLILGVFLFASICDIKERKVEDFVPIMLLLIGLINISPSMLLGRSLIFSFSFIFLLVVAVISNNKIGGADVKFIPACLFILGAGRGIFGLVAGLVFAIIGTLIRNKVKKSEDKTLPLIPYLSAGFILGYLI